MYDFFNHIDSELDFLEQNSATRNLKILPEGILNFASNDYLGLSRDTNLYSQFLQELQTQRPKFSSTSSRLLSGNSAMHEQLEYTLKKLFNRPALVFNSGYHCNLGILPAICTLKSLIIADKLVHASIIDGIRLSGCDFLRFKHNDFNHLEKLIKSNIDKYSGIIICCESIYSMDGDITDLEALVSLKNKYSVALYVDEAHATGVFGKNGLGLAEEYGVIDKIDVLIGTFGKAVSSVGAFAIVQEKIRNYLINKMRPFIFSTALPPAVAMWTNFVVSRLPQMNELRINLKKLQDIYFSQTGYKPQSQIIPFGIRGNAAAVSLAQKLWDNSIFCPAIRYPTVAKNSERLRISLCADMTENDIKKLCNILKPYNQKCKQLTMQMIIKNL